MFTLDVIGVLKRIEKLLEDGPQSSICVLLSALTVITKHYALGRSDAARLNVRVLRLLEVHTDQPCIMEKAIITLIHVVSLTLDANPGIDDAYLADIAFGPVTRVALDAFCRPDVSYSVMTHVHCYMSSAVRSAPTMCRAEPAMLAFLVAHTRSKTITTRATSIQKLRSICQATFEKEPESVPSYDIVQMKKFLKDDVPPLPLQDSLGSRSLVVTETYALLRSEQEYRTVIARTGICGGLGPRDLLAVGRGIAAVLQTCPIRYAVDTPAFCYYDIFDNPSEDLLATLPKLLTDPCKLLPAATKALRSGTPSAADRDAADILWIHHCLRHNDTLSAEECALSASHRSPDFAFAYYTLALVSSDERALRAAQRGLSCPSASPMLQHKLRYHAAVSAFGLALRMLRDGPPGCAMRRAQSLGHAFLSRALREADAFVAEAPPDARDLATVHELRALIDLVMRGHEMDEDFAELDVSGSRPHTACAVRSSDALRAAHYAQDRRGGCAARVHERLGAAKRPGHGAPPGALDLRVGAQFVGPVCRAVRRGRLRQAPGPAAIPRPRRQTRRGLERVRAVPRGRPPHCGRGWKSDGVRQRREVQPPELQGPDFRDVRVHVLRFTQRVA